MSTLNISLPAAMKTFVDTQVQSGLYSSASNYLRTLIRADQHRCAEALVEAQLLARLASDQGAGGPPRRVCMAAEASPPPAPRGR